MVDSHGSARLSSAERQRRVLGNTGWNVLGSALPAVVALFAVPMLLDRIGTTRFGILTLAWVVFGYFGLFDFGLGRATTRFMASAFEAGRARDAQIIFWKSTLLNLLLGMVGGAVLAVGSSGLVALLNVDSSLRAETVSAFLLLALAVPSITLTSSFRGALEARHEFKLVNAAQIPVSVLTYLGPLVAAHYTQSLPLVVSAIVWARLAGTVILFVLAVRQLPPGSRWPLGGDGWTRKLLGYGGWLSVSNVTGPLLASADRFVIGSMSSMSSVAYYTAPFEALSRITILGQALGRTMLPIYSSSANTAQRRDLYLRYLSQLGVMSAIIASALLAFAEELLMTWLGASFAQRSTVVVQWLAIGFTANGLAALPAAIIHGVGRPDVTAKFHLAQLPAYAVLLFFMVDRFGIAGAAFSWAARALLDMIMLVAYAAVMLGIRRVLLWRCLWPVAATSTILLAAGLLIAESSVGVATAAAAWTGVALLACCVMYAGRSRHRR